MKIALVGYTGKTGSKVCEELIKENYDVLGIDKNTKALKYYINDIDLVIDFTSKDIALKNIQICLDNNKNFIVGTTGFNADELAYIKSKCNEKNIKGIICYNFAMPLNYILNSFNFFNNYFKDMNYLDIHHISKVDKKSGTTYLFLLKNSKIKVKSIKTKQNIITYVVQMSTKYDKIVMTYQVNDKIAFAKGLLYYLKKQDESLIMNLLK